MAYTPTNSPLLPGVEQRPTFNPFGAQSGMGYYYNGTKYDNASAANQASKDAQDHAAAITTATTPNQGMRVNTGAGIVPPAGGGAPGSGEMYVQTPGGGPMVSQGGYEAERLQGLTGSQGMQELNAKTAADAAAATTANTAHTDQMQLAAKLQAGAEARRLGYLSTVTGQGGSPQVQHGNVPFDETAARAAAFGRAKEQAGNTALASLRALHEVMANTGKTGSSMEGQGTADIINGAAGGVNDFTRDELVSNLGRAADIADMTYQGNIQQRGQNLALMPSLMGLITATGSGLY